jgi:acyl-coenzyme A synthetase/AMP-(fatty) acid ligase
MEKFYKNSSDLYQQLFADIKDSTQEFIFSGYTFKQIFELAAGIKNRLSILNNHDNVCLCTENKAFLVASIIASLSGGPSLILPYSSSKMVIQDAQNTIGFKTILTDSTISMDGEFEIITPEMCCERNTGIFPNLDLDAAFLKLFTGGSTGSPKIWSKTPRNIFLESLYHSRKHQITNKDIFLATVPPQHIYGFLFSITVPFISSARVYDRVCTFPHEIINAIKECSPTVLVSIPIHYRSLNSAGINKYSLRFALSSAGMLDQKDGEGFYDRTGVPIFEVYGSTETGGIAYRCRAHSETSWSPFDCLQIKVDDERLCVKSDFNSQELPKDKDGFYRTGDRAIYDQDKFIMLGRVDGIVKVAGKRVDLNEIQDNLKLIPGISDAYIISLSTNKARENEIGALVVSSIDEQSIRNELSSTLEPYSMPKLIKIVEKMPLTSTGKYDRQAIESMFK